MINDDYTPPNEHRRTQHKACIPILFICCECGTIASLWGGGGKSGCFQRGHWEDNVEICWDQSRSFVSVEKQAKSKTKGGVEIGSNDRVWCKVSIFHIKRAGIIFLFFSPKDEPRRNIFSVFLLCQMKRQKQKSNSQVNKCHRQPTALHYCLLHVFTFAAFNKWRPNVTSRKLLWNYSDWRDLSFFFPFVSNERKHYARKPQS